MNVIFDMFGEPRSVREGERGRPDHVATAENIRKVRALTLAGWKVADIAREIGVSPPTLRKVYFRDLGKAREEARLTAKGRIILALEEQVAAGNVAAMKALWKILEMDELRSLPKAMAPAALPQGKKEARKMAAARPRGEWADLIPTPSSDTMQ